MPARILVVDDIPVNVKLLEAKLTAEYFDVITAPDGPSALRIVEAEMPDLILLDVMMPVMDGFEVCERLKANPKTRHIPVIMVTALHDVSDRVRGLKIRVFEKTIMLEGRCATFYCKQLAQHAAMELRGDRSLTDLIKVWYRPPDARASRRSLFLARRC